MFTAKIITTTVILSFVIVFLMNFLQDRPKLFKLFQLMVISSILVSLYNLIAGIYLLSGWEDPLVNATNEQIGQVSAKARGKGGLVIVIVKYWPYALIGYSLYALYYLRYWYQSAFGK
tara:strand:- start:977 stop:1330 length:354 start_codon:yes stop_codon:yes gene_type:complete